MFTVIEERVFCAGHAIQFPSGEWEEIHTHNWLLRVHVCAHQLDHVHLVVDFLLLQALINEVLAPFEGKVINEVAPFVDGISPSTEFLARLFFERMQPKIDDERIWLEKIELREAPTSWAVYQRPTKA